MTSSSSPDSSNQDAVSAPKFDWPSPPTLDQLASMDDAGLSRALGVDDQIQKARKSITDAAALTGKAKELAEERVQRMFTPPSYALNDLSYIVEDAKREAKRSARDELAQSPEPADIL